MLEGGIYAFGRCTSIIITKMFKILIKHSTLCLVSRIACKKILDPIKFSFLPVVKLDEPHMIIYYLSNSI
jgi:hypothetical protein